MTTKRVKTIYPCKHSPSVIRRFFLLATDKKVAPCAVMRQGAFAVQDYLRSLVIPFVAEVRGEKSGKQDNSQNCHKYVHISQHVCLRLFDCMFPRLP